MNFFYLDASAWVKLHFREVGTDWMIALWDSDCEVVSSVIGLVETVAAVARKHGGLATPDDETKAACQKVDQHYAEMAHQGLDFAVLSLARELAVKHRLRGADSIHLASAIVFQQLLDRPLSLVASDAELLIAAKAEGLAVLDPRENPPLPQ